MSNITLFIILLAAAISYGQISVKYNPETDRVEVSLYSENPPNTVDQTETTWYSFGDNFIYQNDYWYGDDELIYHQSIIFDDYGNELIYSETKRIISNGRTIIKANGKYFRGFALIH